MGQDTFTSVPATSLGGELEKKFWAQSYIVDAAVAIIMGTFFKLVAGKAQPLAGPGDVPVALALLEQHDRLNQLDANGNLKAGTQFTGLQFGVTRVLVEENVSEGDRLFVRCIASGGNTVVGAARKTNEVGNVIDLTGRTRVLKDASAGDFAWVLVALGNADLKAFIRQFINAAGAQTLDRLARLIHCDGAAALNDVTSTLADGLFDGQQISLVMSKITATKRWIITVTNFYDGATITFTTAGDNVELRWSASLSKWVFVTGTFARIA